MSNLVPFTNSDIQIPADYKAAGAVIAVPGSGVNVEGGAVLVLRPTMIELRSKAGIAAAVHVESILRVQECEFRGLIIERSTDDGTSVLSAPNETFGVEITYKSGGNFERKLKLVVFSATNARQWVDVINRLIGGYWDDIVKHGSPIIRE